MMKTTFTILAGFVLVFFSFQCNSQGVEDNPLLWEDNRLNIGAVLEENGEVLVDYYFVNKEDFPVIIEEVITDCGCTTTDYPKDTLFQGKVGQIKIKFDPQSRGGTFSKAILVKTNIDSEGDSIFLEGVNIPFPQDVESHYKIRKEGLGFVFPLNNLGTLFTHQEKIKYLDFYNFKDDPIQLNQIQNELPEHLSVKMLPTVVQPDSRGIIEITFDPSKTGELGFFEEDFSLSFLSSERFELNLKLVATIHEHFDPVPVTKLDSVPRLEMGEYEIDLGNITSANPITKTLTLENAGGEALNIRKVITNCDCLTFDLPTYDLKKGDKTDLVFTFNPSGRRGIDHKTLTIFSNDPLNPTRTVLIKSRIN